MPASSLIPTILSTPGILSFPSNLPYRQDFETAGGHYVRQPSGHLAFYGPEHRRFLATDPDGNPLHECEWASEGEGRTRLTQARLRLDWGQWIGLKPEGLINSTTLDLSKKPGWQRLRPDNLRQMAAQAMRVPLEEVRFFYSDKDLVIDAHGRATIRHKKDAFYVLDDGTLAHARFMACMGAMHWSEIDFLPVVELFQSLLPGTGSAVFELIRGLYDDQQEDQPHPSPLRYRGIPTYPSEAAFRLFNAFFIPQVPDGSDPLPVFMDQPRSYQVTWLPRPNPPLRYFDKPHHLCVTAGGQKVLKATLANDSSGLSYNNIEGSRVAPCGRSLRVEGNSLILIDRTLVTTLPISPTWGSLKESSEQRVTPNPIDWQTLFEGIPPKVSPSDAFASTLLYPDDETEIGELSTQPFVTDYVQDLLEEDPRLADLIRGTNRAFIYHFDAVIDACIGVDRPREYVVFWQQEAFVQKQAQHIWNRFSNLGRLDWLRQVRMMPSAFLTMPEVKTGYDLLYVWMPFQWFDQPARMDEATQAIERATVVGAIGFVVGPRALENILQGSRLQIIQDELVDTLSTFRMHQGILPKARIKPGLTLYQVRKV